MNLPQAPDPTRIPEHWLARAAWVTVTILAVTLFVGSLPAYYDQLGTACTGSACISYQLTPEGMQLLQELGLSTDFYAAYSLVLAVLFTGVCLAVAAVIFWRASGERMALIGGLMLVLFGVVFPETPRALAHHPLWYWPVSVLGFLGFVSSILFINLFPSGRFVPGWTLWAALVWIAAAGQGIFFPGSTDQPWVSLLNTLGFACAASASLGALVYRYRHKADQTQRQQVKWVVFGVTVGLGGVVLMALLAAIFPALGQPGLFDTLGIRSAQTLLLLSIPLSIGVAILRYRLWDVDLVINRTLVYGALTACVVGTYVLVVGYLGALFRAESNRLISLAATGIVAVLFAPLRERLQRAVNRLMYGERDEPYAVLSRLGQRLEAALDPKSVLPTIVETVAGALKSPHAEVFLYRDGGFETAARHGTPAGDPLVLPLTYGNETVGRLAVSPRAKGEPFTPADWKLLEDLAERAREAVADVRRSVHALRPPVLDDLGLVPALRETAAQYGHNGLSVSVEASADLTLLPAAVEVAAYRIAQEAMANVVRHAGARSCAIRFDLDEETGVLRLEVADDGRGVGEDPGSGVGLFSMRERAEELGGTCVVGPSPAGGTRVRAELPFLEVSGKREELETDA